MKLSKINLFSTKDLKEKVCQSCVVQKLESKVICGVCKTVRSMRPSEYIKNKLNYFSIFNMDDKYLIDKQKLDIQYKDLQKILHPDKYVTENEELMKEAQDCSAFVSNAYNILKDDYQRANYLVNHILF